MPKSITLSDAVMRRWLQGAMSGCKFAPTLAKPRSKAVHYASLPIVAFDERTPALVNAVMDEAGAAGRAVVLSFPRLSSASHVAALLRCLRRNERWTVDLLATALEHIDIAVTWETRGKKRSRIMRLAPLGTMPVTRRSPYVAIAGWTGAHGNPWNQPKKARAVVMFSDMPHGLTLAQVRSLEGGERGAHEGHGGAVRRPEVRLQAHLSPRSKRSRRAVRRLKLLLHRVRTALLLLLLTSCTPRSSPTAAVDAAAAAVSTTQQEPLPLPEAAPPPLLPERPTLPLAQQVEMKISDARAAFPGIRIRVLRDAFVLAVVGSPALLERTAAYVDRTLTAYYNGRFVKPPAYAVLLYFFERFDEYDKYVRTNFGVRGNKFYGVYGKYSHVAAVDGSHVDAYLPSLAHELVHPILDGDLGMHRPEWASECIASLFEAPTFPAPGEIRGQPNWRFREVLHPALHPADGGAPAEVSLPALFHLDDATFLATQPDGGTDEHTQDLHWAVARSFCLYMDKQGKLWPWVAAWRGHLAEDPTGETAFTAVMGQTPAEADASWRKWVDRL